MVYKGNATQVSLLHEGPLMQPPTPKSGDSTVEKGKGKQVLTQNTSPTKTSQSPNPTYVISIAQPHQSQSHPQPTPCSHNMKTSIVSRWISKRLLQAQGYFNGEGNV